MEDSSKSGPTSGSTPNLISPIAKDGTSELESLRHLLLSVIVLVIIVSGSFNIYLLRETKHARQQRTGMAPSASQILATYNAARPGWVELTRRLTEFGRTNPDYVPILTKYGLKPETSIAPATSAPASSPAATAPKKANK